MPPKQGVGRSNRLGDVSFRVESPVSGKHCFPHGVLVLNTSRENLDSNKRQMAGLINKIMIRKIMPYFIVVN